VRVGILRTGREYHVFERLADVPASLVEDTDLVVERVVLLDANKTTTGRATYQTPGTLEAERRRQAGGIQSYFAGFRAL
jgi:hypothetical protein